MEELGASRARIGAAIGPCISQTNYEVGPEFRDAFRGHGFRPRALFSKPGSRPDHWQFDLEGFVADRLAEAEIRDVERLATCTYADADAFFSFRRTTHRGEPDYGRDISAIVLKR